MRSIIILLAVLLVPSALMAQWSQQWVTQYNDPYSNGADKGSAVVRDANGNVYIAGCTYRGGGYGYDFWTIKYNGATGDVMWANQ